ncbi:anaerobic ribonucleoside-triphosphate reductase activating protein [Corynebacterium sp.]|uniref:anaerobic ribonucleoside-triphosphate reductase activating protein n=1 Tax=Corynebacterium sp. TaxID=1720 RepID=UPI0026DC6D0D|nr:anaerobic ribonucleoside-triphosphate reductase activating protein [Corynebacterium sp.]MDO5075994.1 anaerobic ribonucleoside-triphosphate reductase activating protein [Corynebacterium sp.]
MSACTSLNHPPPDLPTAGFLPFSATDWPGKLTATVFTQGCPLRCSYCHNPQLQRFGAASGNFSDVISLLARRRSLLDALVFTGGEPTTHRTLPDVIEYVHAMGFPVGLHTCGYSPKRLARLFARPETTPDWIGLDVKALPGDLPAVTGCTPRVAERMWDSVALVAKSGVDVQIRTTVWPDSVVSRGLNELRERVVTLGLPPPVVQVARNVDSWGYYMAG